MSPRLHIAPLPDELPTKASHGLRHRLRFGELPNAFCRDPKTSSDLRNADELRLAPVDISRLITVHR